MVKMIALIGVGTAIAFTPLPTIAQTAPAPLHSAHLKMEAVMNQPPFFDYQVAAALTFKGEIDVAQLR